MAYNKLSNVVVSFPTDEEDSPLFRMFYQCACGETWEMIHECCCNDRCPSCDTENEAYEVEDV